MNRITTIDVTRGLVMVIMALDHVRDLLHTSATTQDPTDLAVTTAPLFLTRWITHLCAPTFVFLSGMSAYLSVKKQQHSPSSRLFLLKRGLVLILLELTLVNFAFWFDIQFRTILLQVIYAIGGGLVVVSLLARLPVRWVGILGLVIIFGHNLLQAVPVPASHTARFVESLFFRVNVFQPSPSFALIVGYPLLPWLGIMLVGFAGGSLLDQPLVRRKQTLLRLGLASLGLFLLLRFINVYGDPVPWSVRKDTLFTMLSFINVTKYPPSLLYDLLMLGVALLLLSLADGADNAITRWLTVYGKVPMFYYIIHWYAVHLLMIAMILIQGYAWHDIRPGTMSFGRPAGAGVELGLVYLVWGGLVLALYPLCRWYGRYKASHPSAVLLRYI
ncbi:heparan-alpha-glucosaminide N-acetyltransferase domain-containing protein [Spirosoma sp. RP8]|uniref:Heparan-alpha-glucosaminide N-acetyltransferase domain-containing protein n=1 Tax=Spirosoma liriopis TaxID=2937440 RepID=A0ABT0HDM0_9BACT|nr:heparan-alpha-glucosaminide N-acetyltransferase domain-containing protein [Spirosoma liriopis]MCK8490256.1 heparan-alpha-glucosaminide N-acetyltransferase domain-containing protein [Spirosoma liriopis]